ncbi:hypothetical protein SAMN05216317_103145 [Nitrosomonas eutropha]|nr:hypothetical protein SAMN05216379_10298 [Nitrosomonas eutropha]SDW25091.1 hypothetical protein SAMN05216317_103145 [Nitrosomonas eutropha]
MDKKEEVYKNPTEITSDRLFLSDYQFDDAHKHTLRNVIYLFMNT